MCFDGMQQHELLRQLGARFYSNESNHINDVVDYFYDF